MERIADLVRRHRTRSVTTAAVVRWLAALHNAKNDPDLAFTREQAVMFPLEYRVPAANGRVEPIPPAPPESGAQPPATPMKLPSMWNR